MAELSWTDEAEVSLRDIHDYIARDRPTTARRTVESIVDRAHSLREFPELGHRYPYDPSVRILAHGHFQIAYSLLSRNPQHADADGEHVVVLGVFHGLIFLPLK